MGTDLLISSVSGYFILRGFLPVIMLSASLFTGWFLSFDSHSVQRVQWPVSIVIRNAYFLLVTLCDVSLIRWIRDPVHKYFIFVQDKRTRTIIHQHRHQLLKEPGDVSFASNPLANQSRSFLGNTLGRQISSSSNGLPRDDAVETKSYTDARVSS